MEAAIETKKIKLEETQLSYKKGFKWYAVPYNSITNAYMRIEEVKGRLCCGVADFDMHFLMLKTESGLIKIELESKEIVKAILEKLHCRNPQIKIGYYKTEEKREQLFHAGDDIVSYK